MHSHAALDSLFGSLDVAVRSFSRTQVKQVVTLAAAPPRSILLVAPLDRPCQIALPGAEARRCVPGIVGLVPPASAATVHALDGAAVQVAAGVVGVQLADTGLLDRTKVPIFADLGRSPFVRDALIETARLDASRARVLGAQALSDSLVKSCVLAALSDFCQRPGIDHKIVSALASPRLGGVVAAILHKPQGSHSLDSMARLAGMGRSAFSRHFNEAMGLSPIDFLVKTRLYHGAEMLRLTGSPIKSVAANVGFASRSHFSRAFREHFGVDPSAYRRDQQSVAPAPVAQDLRVIATRSSTSDVPH